MLKPCGDARGSFCFDLKFRRRLLDKGGKLLHERSAEIKDGSIILSWIAPPAHPPAHLPLQQPSLIWVFSERSAEDTSWRSVQIPGRAGGGHGHHPVEQLVRQQREQGSILEREPGVFLQRSRVIGQGRANEAGVHVGLKVTTTDKPQLESYGGTKIQPTNV